MKFLDNVIININAGNGGNGCISFINKSNKKKIPNGGCGGNGGNIYLVSKNYVYSLNEFKYKYNFFSENGNNGKKNNCTGKCGKNLFINVPIGTLVYNFTTKEFICDLINDSQKFLIAKGGIRGLGNVRISKITKKYLNKDVNYYLNGKIGEKIIIELKLKLISDVGIFGLTNSGKSSFFKLITNSKNIKISDYLLTTLFPKLGHVYLNNYKYFSILDIPGFIFNIKYSKITNYKFLTHLYRCKILLHIIDISLIFNKYFIFIKYIKMLNKVLYLNSINIKNKEIFIIFNKSDLYINNDNINYKITKLFNNNNINFKYYIISSIKYDFNINNLINKIYDIILKN